MWIRRTYTPASEITRALEKSVSKALTSTDYGSAGTHPVRSIRPGSMQTRLINGQQAAIFVIDVTYEVLRDGAIAQSHSIEYRAIIQTESNVIEFWASYDADNNLAVFRWLFDPILATAKIP